MMKALTPIILLIAAVAIFFGFIDPEYKKIQAKSAEVAQYDDALTKSDELDKIRITLEKKYVAITDADSTRLEKLLPDSVDNVRLILDLDSIASAHGMKIKNIKFVDKVAGNQKPAAVAISDNPVGSITLSFSVTSSYANFLAFLKDLEQSLRIVDINSLALKTTDQVGVYDFDMAFRTYWLKN